MARTRTVTITLTDPDTPFDPPLEERAFTDARQAEAFIADIATRLFIVDDERYDGTGEWVGFQLTATITEDGDS